MVYQKMLNSQVVLEVMNW